VIVAQTSYARSRFLDITYHIDTLNLELSNHSHAVLTKLGHKSFCLIQLHLAPFILFLHSCHLFELLLVYEEPFVDILDILLVDVFHGNNLIFSLLLHRFDTL
jgi:hypothetical protein